MPDNRKPLIYGAFPVCRNYTVRAYLRRQQPAGRGRHQDRSGEFRPRHRLIHAGNPRPCHTRHEAGECQENDRVHPFGARCLAAESDHKNFPVVVTVVVKQNPPLKHLTFQRRKAHILPKSKRNSAPKLVRSWWGKVDSNHRSYKQQIYSLSPLATREFPHMQFMSVATWLV